MKIRPQAVFRRAVRLARSFSGAWPARMSLALRYLWLAVKTRPLHKLAAKIEDSFAASGLRVECKVWEKYGMSRVYVSMGGLRHAYFSFDKRGQYIAARNPGASCIQFEIIKQQFERAWVG